MSFSRSRDINKMSSRSTFFVFYKLNGKSSWKYPNNMPAGWWWVGKGSTIKADGTINKKTPCEEQFSGLSDTKEEMKTYLERFFQGLVNERKLVRYVIHDGYPKI